MKRRASPAVPLEQSLLGDVEMRRRTSSAVAGGGDDGDLDMADPDVLLYGANVDASMLHLEQEHKLTPAEAALMNSYQGLDYQEVENDLYRRELAALTPSQRRNRDLAKWFIMFAVGFMTGLFAFGISQAVTALSSAKFSIVNGLMCHDEPGEAAASSTSGSGGGGSSGDSDGNGSSLPSTACTGSPLGVVFLVFWGFNAMFVGLASFLVAFVEPVAGGSGIPELKGYLNGTNYRRALRLKTLFCKVTGVCFSVSGNLCIGKEGPLVHTGAILAANFSHLPKLPKYLKNAALKVFRTDQAKRDFVSAGAAAGVAAAFGAPVGGILFSLEEASSYWSLELTWRTFFCAMVSTFTLNIFQSGVRGAWLNVDSPGLITFGSFRPDAYKLWEMVPFLLMAAVGGILGAIFCSLNTRVSKWRRDVLAGRSGLRMLEAFAVVSVSTVLWFWVPYALAHCTAIPGPGQLGKYESMELYETARFNCDRDQFNPTAAALFGTWEQSIKTFFHMQTHLPWYALLASMCCFFVMAVWTYGIAVPSGLFVPCILIGSCMGRLGGQLVSVATGVDVDTGLYALIGAACMLGGVTRMTISLTVILLETTNDLQYLLPIMSVVMVAKWVGDLFNISLYDVHVELKCMPFVENAPPGSIALARASDICSKDVVTVGDVETVGRLLEVLHGNSHNGFPVVTSDTDNGNGNGNGNGSNDNDNSNNNDSGTGGGGRLIGIILRSQLVVLLEKQIYSTTPPDKTTVPKAHPDLRQHDFAPSLSSQLKDRRQHFNFTAEQQQSLYVDLRPYMAPAPFSVQKACPVARVYRLFRSMGMRSLCVVSTNNKVVGIITRKDIRSDFTSDLV